MYFFSLRTDTTHDKSECSNFSLFCSTGGTIIGLNSPDAGRMVGAADIPTLSFECRILPYSGFIYKKLTHGFMARIRIK